MFIEFSVRNFASIKEMQTLSMMAAPVKSKNQELDLQNVFDANSKIKLLKSVAIYGANGSGKSNVVKALLNMLIFIRDSMKDDKLGEFLIEPFLLNVENREEPTFFQITFIHQNIRYRYGFELKKNEVITEWLFGTPDKKEVYFFTREKNKIQINENQFPEGKGLEDKTSATNLFLNVAKAFNGKVAKAVAEFFTDKIAISGGISDFGFRSSTLLKLKDENEKKTILSLLNLADFGMVDIDNKQISKEDIPSEFSNDLLPEIAEGKIQFILSKRPVYNNLGDQVAQQYFMLDKHESEGTKKLFNYSGAIIETLVQGGILILDEFDARLHPLLTKKMVEMFHSSVSNKNNAQLVFVTHDTNLLDNDLLRRDQIYFTEKNKLSETVLYSLADFKGIRNDASYEKDYIKGKYGAIPFLGNFDKLFE